MGGGGGCTGETGSMSRAQDGGKEEVDGGGGWRRWMEEVAVT